MIEAGHSGGVQPLDQRVMVATFSSASSAHCGSSMEIEEADALCSVIARIDLKAVLRFSTIAQPPFFFSLIDWLPAVHQSVTDELPVVLQKLMHAAIPLPAVLFSLLPVVGSFITSPCLHVTCASPIPPNW